MSVGLADLVGKCLATDPGDRYPDMSALASDLRRHLVDLPLRGVRNRSLAERWRKWRRRRPHGVALAGMMLAVLTATAAVAIGAADHYTQRAGEARAALTEGQAQIDRGDWEGAVLTLRRGRDAARGLPLRRDLADDLDSRLLRAEQGRAAAERAASARELHEVAGSLRFLYGADSVPPEALRKLEAPCRAFWEDRLRVVERLGRPLQPAVRDDLLDLAILWADLQVRLAPPAGKDEARRKARTALDQAETSFGPSPVLDAERALHGAPPSPGGHRARAARTAWEHYALARALLRAGDLRRAAEEAGQAVRLRPQGLWPNFYQGLCAYRLGHYEDAVTAYSVCIGSAPRAGCFCNRALAFAALGRTERALRDYDQALGLDPTLAFAALNRGLLHYRAGHHDDALADLGRARELGADPAAVSFDLAVVHLARGERAAALDDLRRALAHDPHHPDARKLRDRLRGPPTSSRTTPPDNSAPASPPQSR